MFSVVVAAVLAAMPVYAQQPSGNPLVGAWKILESPEGPQSQPSLWIFTNHHFSRMAVQGPRARNGFKDPAKPTVDEKAVAFDTFGANTGSYEVVGDTIVFHVVVAKAPVVGSQGQEQQFAIKNGTLTITNARTGATFKLARLE
jgi:hypothetical protein